MRVRAWPAYESRCRNPYHWLLYSQLRRLGVEVEEWSPSEPIADEMTEDPLVYHIHWPEHLLRTRSREQARERVNQLFDWFDHARGHGQKTFWTIHSFKHQRTRHPDLERDLFNTLARRIDGVIHMSRGAKDAIERAFPTLTAKPAYTIPHGHYRDVFPETMSRAEARRSLDIAEDARVITFVGQIRHHKNLPTLVRALRSLKDPNTVLLLEGEVPDPQLAAEIAFVCGGDRRVRFTPVRLADLAMQKNVSAADVVVLPYSRVLNSGAAMLALSLDRPILVPDVGAMPDLQRRVGRDWVYTYQGELRGVDLECALEASTAVMNARADLRFASWERIAERTLEAFRETQATAEPALS